MQNKPGRTKKMKRALVLISMLFSVWGIPVFGTDYYVSPGGDDDNPGTKDLPLKTLQVAANKLQAGDILYVLPGTYRESLVLNGTGLPGSPIQIIAEPGTVVIDGTTEINTEWSLHENDIYKTYFEGSVLQVFQSDTMLTEARWPNFTFPSDLWKRSSWASTQNGSVMGKIVDNDIAATNIDWTGALAVLNIEAQFWTWTSTVSNHSAGSNTFFYFTHNLAGLRDNLDFTDDFYYLTGKYEALDIPGEWHYDTSKDTLYLYRRGGGQPLPGEIEVKVSNYGIQANNKDYIYISGLDFFGCTFRLENCDFCIVENCNLIYPSYNREIPERLTSGGASPSSYLKGNDNIIRNCVLNYASGNGLRVTGQDNLIENNKVSNVAWSGTLDYNAINTSKLSGQSYAGNIIRQNTVYNAGNSLLDYSGPSDIIELNEVRAAGLLCKDVSAVYTVLPNCEFSQVRFNWVYTVESDHLSLGIRGDDKTRRLRVHHNVVWDISWEGIVVKGDENHIFNNTLFNCRRGSIYLETGLEPSKPWHDHIPEVMANENSYLYNNLTEKIYGNRFTYIPPAGDLQNNKVIPGYRGLLVNRAHRDFRPRLGSDLVNNGKVVPEMDDLWSLNLPDVGAYEFGDENYWYPGYQENIPSGPIPADQSLVESDQIDLIWRPAYKAESYDIYVGDDLTSVEEAGKTSGLFKGNQENNIFQPGSIAAGQTVFWRVDAVYPDSTLKGDVWEFTSEVGSSGILHKIEMNVHAITESDTLSLQDALISTNEMISITDTEGRSLHYTRSDSSLQYSINKKGFLPFSKEVEINSDTVFSDTLVAAINAFDFEIKVADKLSEDALEGCIVRLGEGEGLLTGPDGFVNFENLSYGFYDIHIEKEGFEPGIIEKFELYSDTSFTIFLTQDYYQVGLDVFDRASLEKIRRAQLYVRDDILLSGSDGSILLESGPGELEISVVHEDYFTYEDTLMITGDNLFPIPLTRKRANLTIEVVSGEAPLSGAGVSLNESQRETGFEGKALFLNYPARTEYTLNVSKDGYKDTTAIVFLEIDTTIRVPLSLANGLGNPSEAGVWVYPNPATEIIYLILPEKSTISLSDLTGKEWIIQTMEPGERNLLLKRIPRGVYVLSIKTKNHFSQMKMVLQ